MQETKPFMSTPSWANPHHRGHHHRRADYFDDLKQAVAWFYKAWKYPLKNRTAMRFFKIFIVFALFITCVINLKIAIDAKVRFEQHKVLFADPLKREIVHQHEVKDVFEEESNFKGDIEIEVLSSKDLVEVKINGTIILSKNSDKDRGLHIVILNQLTAEVTASQSFDTYLEGEADDVTTFLDTVRDLNRILIFTVKDEASFHLKKETRDMIESLGSSKIHELQWRSMWAMITNKKGNVIAEKLSTTDNTASWANSVKFKVLIKPVDLQSVTCNWPSSPENLRRERFCSRFDGYRVLCNCNVPYIRINVKNFTNNLMYDVPVAVIASNRPRYLFRMLMSLLLTSGVNPSKVTVFIDGHFEEPMQVANLLGIQGIYHTPVGVKNARISQNYRSSLSAIFGLNPSAKYAIILEEDLDLSPDFFMFFSQTLHLIENDPTIYCISAWNDHGYHHSCQDPQLLYRVESFPGLGWLLSRKLFKEELEPHWPEPEKQWDWDMWMRQSEIMKGRECIIPDISRTFHFGTSGVNMNSYFHDKYFKRHSMNPLPATPFKNVDSLTEDNYEKHMHLLIRESTLADHDKSPCQDDFVADSSPVSGTYVTYIKMDTSKEVGVFQKLFTCLKTWDLDIRGLHKYSFRTYIKKRHFIFIGYPVSPYSIYKPVHVEPVSIVLEDEKPI